MMLVLVVKVQEFPLSFRPSDVSTFFGLWSLSLFWMSNGLRFIVSCTPGNKQCRTFIERKLHKHKSNRKIWSQRVGVVMTLNTRLLRHKPPKGHIRSYKPTEGPKTGDLRLSWVGWGSVSLVFTEVWEILQRISRF